MDELVKLVSERTGLPQAQAKVAVDTVLGFVKEKLPAPLASQVDALVGGSGSGGSGDLLKGLGGLLGSK